MLAIIESRTFCLLVCSPKTLEYKKTIILPVVLHGCEILSLTLREKHRLRVFEKGLLRIFGPKRDFLLSSGTEKSH
jgi:hypothetical protein